MMSTSEIRKLPSLGSDARKAVAGTFSALSQWRNEISAANARYLTKALDQMAAAQRALGWPDHVTAAAREHLLKASKIQAHVIDQIMEAWEEQLKSRRDPAGVPSTFKLPSPAFSEQAFANPMSEMMRMGEMALVPFKLWVRAAEAWQRNWAATMSARSGRPEPRPARKPRERARRPRLR